MISKYRFPPLLLVLLFCGLMSGASFLLPSYQDYPILRLVLSILMIFSGISFVSLGITKFRSNHTTINPYKPEKSSTLVTTGIYSITRNPMYVGFVLVLVGWAIYFANLAALPLSITFVIYMNSVQIPEEEKALVSVFGECYNHYKIQVRRWL